MHDSVPLQVANFEPKGTPKGVIQAVHGFGMHIDKYKELADFFNGNGYAFVIHDQRGFGMMPGTTKEERKWLQGIILDYKLFLDDITAIRELINVWYPEFPVILYGQSMGGNIATNYLLTRKQIDYSKLILESPWLRLYKPLSKILSGFTRILAAISHKLAIVNKLDPSHIVRAHENTEDDACTDEHHDVRDYKKDEHYHNRISFKLLVQVTDAGEFAIKNSKNITIPTLVLCAGHDKVVCTKAIHEFYDNADKNMVLQDFPTGYHSLHSDLIKVDVWKRMLEFCNE
jgi:alpha-beta hydrolase superfamily lysophospholipase